MAARRIGEAANPGPRGAITICLVAALGGQREVATVTEQLDELEIARRSFQAAWRVWGTAVRRSGWHPDGAQAAMLAIEEQAKDTVNNLARQAVATARMLKEEAQQQQERRDANEAEGAGAEEPRQGEESEEARDLQKAEAQVKLTIEDAFMDLHSPLTVQHTEEVVAACNAYAQAATRVTTSGPVGADGADKIEAESDFVPRPRKEGNVLRELEAARRRTHPNRRRGRGRRDRKRKGQITIFYANGNTFSQKVREHMEASEDDIYMLGETHMRGEALRTAAKEVAANGWAATWAPSAQSTTAVNGSYGGTMVAARSWMATSPCDGDEVQGRYSLTKRRDVAARTVRVDGGEIKVMSGYADTVT